MNKPNQQAPGVEFEAVSFSYDRQPFLKNLSLQIQAGLTTVLFGPSGAGKTTCLRLIAGFESPQSGAIKLGGVEVASAKRFEPPAKRNVGYCFQEAALWGHLKVRDHVLAPLRAFKQTPSERDRRVNEILSTFSLCDLAGRYPDQLSGGERKRLEFARATAGNPDILILDEPLTGADGPRRNDLMPYIRACGNDSRAVVIVTHHHEEALALADELMVFDQGRVLRAGGVEEVFRDPQSIQASRLLGRQTILPATLQAGTIVTPVGEWPGHPVGDEDGYAGWLLEDIQISNDGTVEAVVHSCELIGRGYRTTVRCDENELVGIAKSKGAAGDIVKLLFNQPPVWIPTHD